MTKEKSFAVLDKYVETLSLEKGYDPQYIKHQMIVAGDFENAMYTFDMYFSDLVIIYLSELDYERTKCC